MAAKSTKPEVTVEAPQKSIEGLIRQIIEDVILERGFVSEDEIENKLDDFVADVDRQIEGYFEDFRYEVSELVDDAVDVFKDDFKDAIRNL